MKPVEDDKQPPHSRQPLEGQHGLAVITGDGRTGGWPTGHGGERRLEGDPSHSSSCSSTIHPQYRLLAFLCILFLYQGLIFFISESRVFRSISHQDSKNVSPALSKKLDKFLKVCHLLSNLFHKIHSNEFGMIPGQTG